MSEKVKLFITVTALTFAQLVTGPLLAVAAALALPDPNYHALAVTGGIAAAGAFIASLAAGFYALKVGRAVTAIQKAWRTLFEGVGQVLSGIVINQAGDIIALPKLIAPLLIGVVLSAGVTWLQNLHQPPPLPPVPPSG